jgi:HEAT repeat protein
MWIFGSPNVDKLKAKGDVEGLIKALGYQKDWRVREAAASALGEIGDARAMEPLIAALKDHDSDVRQGAAGALDMMDWQPDQSENGATYWVAKGEWSRCVRIGEAAVKPLIAALKGGGLEAREDAAETLGQLGEPAVEPLIIALRDDDEVVREVVVGVLEEIGDARAVEPLIVMLKDESWAVREAAVKALNRLGDARAVDPLIAMLKDESWGMREAAVKALGQIGDARAVEPLVAMLKDDDEDVREAAAEALEQLRRSGGGVAHQRA